MCSRRFRATPRQENPAGRHFETKPTPKPGRQARTEPTGQTLATLWKPATPTSSVNQARSRRACASNRCGLLDLLGDPVCEVGIVRLERVSVGIGHGGLVDRDEP